MNRTTKRVLAAAVSAAMAFSVSFSAFAEQATPETAIPAEQQQSLNSVAVQSAEKAEGVAIVSGSQDGTWTQTPCVTLQEAFDLAAGMTDSVMIQLTTDVEECVTLDHVKNTVINLDLNGYHITGSDKPALHLGSDFDGGNLVIVDDNGQGGISGNNAAAIMVDKTTQIAPTLYVSGGVYRSSVAPGVTSIVPVVENYGKSCLVGGTFIGTAGQPVIENHGAKYEVTNNGYVYLGGAVFRADPEGYLFKNSNDEENATASLWVNGTYDADDKEIKGQFYGKLGDEDSLSGILSVKSGKFENKLDARFLNPGSTQTEEDGMYVVNPSAPAAAVGNENFDTVQSAIYSAAAKTNPIHLLRNVTENLYNDSAEGVTLDLNGFTLTQNEGGQLQAVITNNGTLTILGDGTLTGTLAMYNENAVTYLENRDLLQGDLAEGVAFMKDKAENGYYVIRAYDIQTAAMLTDVLDAAEKVVQDFYGNEQKLVSLTDNQLQSAARMTADQKTQVSNAYNTLKSQDKAALERVLATEKYAALSDSCDMLEKLYDASSKTVDVDTASKKVASEVDASKAEVPKTEEKIPAEKQPTTKDAENAVNAIVTDVTGNSAVNTFKENNLDKAVDLTKLPEVDSADKLTFSVQVVLKSVELNTQVDKDKTGAVTSVNLLGKTLVYNVEPMVSADGASPKKLENSQLNGSNVKVRLPVPKDVAEKYAKVSHAGDADRYLPILTDGNDNKYVEFTVTHFSDFVVNFTNTLPAVKKDETSAPAATPAPTQAPAQKSDGKDIYYTCTACGYHDWTAIDEGYKCNHCGHIESVKQLSGYSNVKGVYEPKTGAAAAQKTAVKSAAIPQTSDEMPIAAITLVALAALLGFGVTAYRKFHN